MIGGALVQAAQQVIAAPVVQPDANVLAPTIAHHPPPDLPAA